MKIVLLSISFLFAVSFSGFSQIRDVSFANNGMVTKTPHGSDDARKVAFIPDEKVYVSGYTNMQRNSYTMRLLWTGEIDVSFGTKGIINHGYITPTQILIQKDKKVLELQSYFLTVIIARYTTDGSPDSSFGNNGQVNLGTTSYQRIFLQDDGKILTFSGLDNKLLRLKEDGTVDSTFGNNGQVLFQSIPQGRYTISSMDVSTSGKIFCAGRTSDGSWNVINCYLSNGQQDLSFGSNGTVVYKIRNANTMMFNMPVKALPDGGVLFVRNEEDGGFTIVTSMTKFDEYGKKDHSFGNRGVSVVILPSFINSAELDDMMNIYLFCPEAILKCTANGSIDSAYGVNGFMAFKKNAAANRFIRDYAFTSKKMVSLNYKYLDGVSSYSLISLLNENLHRLTASNSDALSNKEFSISIFPNPAQSVVNISGLDPSVNVKIEILDMNGNTSSVMTVKKAKMATMDISQLKRGMYFIQVIKNNEIHSVKLNKL